MQLPPALFLMGPTASGKTDLAVALAQQGSYEIISVDSALIYRNMDVGTAKPDAELLAKAPHHLINMLDPKESYSAADFRRDALELMADITARGRIPLLVGGTMMYFKMLQQGMASLPTADAAIRQCLLDETEQFGWAHLHQRLAEVDAVAAQRIKPTDTQRLQRALEVFELTGKPLSYWHQQQAAEAIPYDITAVAIAPTDRAILHERIALRFHLMIENGLVDEVRRLYQRGDLNTAMPSIRAVGYRQVWQYLEGELSYDEMIERGIIATRQLAKRQMTWLRSWEDLHWIDSLSSNPLKDLLAIITNR